MDERRVVITDGNFPSFEKEASVARHAGATFETYRCSSAEEVVAAVADANVVLVQFAPLNRQALESLRPHARVIRYGVGYDNIDMAAARALGIEVAYVPDYCTHEVADHTASLMLSLLRKLPQSDASVRRGRWSAVEACRPLQPFSETTLGFLGLGRIGRAVLERLRAFEFRFISSDPALTAISASGIGVEPVTLEEVFARSDVLSLHAPSTPGTRHIVNAQRLRSMRATAIIVNTARGDLIDLTALAEALKSGWIQSAGLDVFEREPLPTEHPLRRAPNVLLTPHSAWYSDRAIDRLQASAADELRRALEGVPARCSVPELC
jgi:D-3-phosphoglycerate dehydrogenase / 2-oxoglutarate reductase